MEPQKTPRKKGRVVLYNKSAPELMPWLVKLEEDDHLLEVRAYCYRPAQLLQELLSLMPMIDAAGGLVWQDNKLLFIYRHNRWDLPKGKLEPGESVDMAAMREVEEECGVSGLHLTGFFAHTYHTYRYKGELVVKRSFWYDMSCSFRGELVPQLEEGITEVRWIEPDLWEALVYTNTYGSIACLLQQKQSQAQDAGR
ncbi:MAG: NUDIX hydrolase [Bacteroidia bacterium]